MTGVLRRPMAQLIALAAASVLLVVSASAISAASTTTYKAGGVQFQVAFPYKATLATATATQIASICSGFGTVSGTAAFSTSATSSKETMFRVEVTTFTSATTASANFTLLKKLPDTKKESIDGRSAILRVGSQAALNLGTWVPNKNASEGSLMVLDGTSVLEAIGVTPSSAKTSSFLNSLKILPS